MTGPIKGAALIVVASAFVAMTTVIAKQLGTSEQALSAVQITWGRYFFALAGLLCFAAVKRPKLEPINKGLHFMRVSFGVCGVMALFAASTLIPLADANAITFLNPIIAMVIAAVFLKEQVGHVRWSMAALAFLGALLLIRPGTASFQPAALVALLSALCLGVEVTFVKRLSGREPVFQILLMSNGAGTLITSILMWWFWAAPTNAQWLLLILVGFIMLCAQSLYVPALKLGDASFVVPFSYSTLLFAALYDVAFFGVLPVPLSVLGATVILLSGVVMAWREGRAQRRNVH